jgi:hypothetical protein
LGHTFSIRNYTASSVTSRMDGVTPLLQIRGARELVESDWRRARVEGEEMGDRRGGIRLWLCQGSWRWHTAAPRVEVRN